MTSSTALQNDDALFLPLQADSVWFFASAIFAGRTSLSVFKLSPVSANCFSAFAFAALTDASSPCNAR